VEKVQKVFQVLEQQEQVDPEVEVKVIQRLLLQHLKLEQQEILHQQLLLKEMLEEMEFTLVVQEVLKLELVAVELEHADQMLHNQVLQTVMLVLVELELLIVLQDHLSLMVAVAVVEKEWPLDVVLLEDQAAAVKVV
tara:strand:+ start:180 stop:590 length:411 start_codon:yes stop_codon:yes gene_type:complete